MGVQEHCSRLHRGSEIASVVHNAMSNAVKRNICQWGCTVLLQHSKCVPTFVFTPVCVVVPCCHQTRASEASASAAASGTFMRSATADGKADAYERRLTGAAEVVEQLRQGIGSLFDTAVSC